MKFNANNKNISGLCIFAIAMGFLESAVVIYLRELYYPGGFQFPLQIIPKNIAMVELCRELATIIMLIGIAYLSGKSKLTRFGYFLIVFAIWDLFYYIFLFLFLGWPQSLFTWDILFLIPVPWTGPVLAPCLVSLGMIVFGSFILHFHNSSQTTRPYRHGRITISSSQWFLLISGSVIIIISFMYDYFEVIKSQNNSASFFPSPKGLLHELQFYIPQKFNWYLFLTGYTLSSLGAILFIKNNLSIITKKKPFNHLTIKPFNHSTI